MTADSLATVIFKKPVWLFLLATPLTAVTFKATLKQGIKNRTLTEAILAALTLSATTPWRIWVPPRGASGAPPVKGLEGATF